MKMRRWFRGFGLLIGLLALAGCGSLDTVIRGLYRTPNLRVSGEGYEGVIFTQANAVNSGMDWLFNEPTEHYWTPAPEDVADLELGLMPYLEQTIPEGDWRHKIVGALDGYKRQYVGVVKAGNPYIWANFFCADGFDDWQDRVVFVMDGGQCFFNIWYNTRSHEFSDLQVNGFA